MADDLGYGEVSAMPGHNSSITTPNIDALLASGVTFTSEDSQCDNAEHTIKMHLTTMPRPVFVLSGCRRVRRRGGVCSIPWLAHDGLPFRSRVDPVSLRVSWQCCSQRPCLRELLRNRLAPSPLQFHPRRGNHAVDGHDLPLRSQDYTLPQLLATNGYDAVHVGKWGLGWADSTGSPWNKSFGYYYGNLDQSLCHNEYPSHGEFQWDNHTQTPIPANTDASRKSCMANGGDSGCVYAQDLWHNTSLQLLRSHAASLSARHAAGCAARSPTPGALAQAPNPNPLFMYVAYTIPHAGGWQGTEEAGNPVPSDGDFSNKPWPDVEKVRCRGRHDPSVVADSSPNQLYTIP